MIVSSPMEQYQLSEVLNLSLSVNNYVVHLVLAALVIPVLGRLHRDEIIPTSWAVFNEALYRSSLTIVHNYVSIKLSVYFPLIFTIFNIVLFSNLLGMIPYSYTPTVQLIMTLSLGFTLLGGILVLGAIRHGSLLFGYFTPAGTPVVLVFLMVFIETVSYLTRTLSLGLRLSINMITGHTLVKVFSGFIWLGFVGGVNFLVLSLPLILLTAFLALELLIAYLQAYIFVFITSITLKDLG